MLAARTVALGEGAVNESTDPSKVRNKPTYKFMATRSNLCFLRDTGAYCVCYSYKR